MSQVEREQLLELQRRQRIAGCIVCASRYWGATYQYHRDRNDPQSAALAHGNVKNQFPKRRRKRR